MYYFLSLLTGILISFMVAVNGGLTQQYGIYSATVIIHIVGLIVITTTVLLKRQWPFSIRCDTVLYLGGAIGVMTTVFNNFSFGRISVSAILALGLLGQSVTGLIIDQYGLFGMKKFPLTKGKLIGLLLIVIGIISMINNLEMLAVAASFAAGVCIVLARTLNAKLADSTSVPISTFYNYFIGLIVSVPAFLILGRNEITEFAISPHWYIYLGGVLGVCVVLTSSITALKISAFYLTLLIFVGQVFSGILIDAVIAQEIALRNLIGGLLVAVGLGVNLLMDRESKGLSH